MLENHSGHLFGSCRNYREFGQEEITKEHLHENGSSLDEKGDPGDEAVHAKADDGPDERQPPNAPLPNDSQESLQARSFASLFCRRLC